LGEEIVSIKSKGTLLGDILRFYLIKSFIHLHVAIQNVMTWSDYHLHEFEIMDPSTGSKVAIGFPDDDFVRRYPCWAKTEDS